MKKLFPFFVLIAWASLATAQEIKIDTFHYQQSGENIDFYGIHIESNEQLTQTKLFKTMYPITIVPYPVLDKVVSIGNRQSILADSLLKANLLLEKQNKLSELEIEKKDKVIEYQKQFIAFSDTTNQLLNKSIGALNLQLNECRQVATDAYKRGTKDKVWGVLIGGGIGFGIGILLGVLVQ